MAGTSPAMTRSHSLSVRCGRQRSIRSSIIFTRPVITNDSTANTIRPANTTLTSKLLAARTITTPSPSCAPKTSATTTPRMARPMASRSPTTMNGSALGTTTRRATSQLLAPNERTTLIKSLSALRTPSCVLIRSGNSAPRKTTATFDHSPMPSHNIKSGRKTSRGVALNAVTNGSNIAFSVADRPSRIPSGRPAAIAKARPIANAVALTPSGAQIVPEVNICHRVAKIRLGTVKNSLVPCWIGMTCGSNSQTTSKSAIVAVPSAIDSMRWRSAGVMKRPAFASWSAIAIDPVVLLTRAPWEGGAFGPADALGQHHGDDHDGENAREHPVDGKNVAEAGDGIADPFGRGEELTDQDGDQRTADGDARAGD